jgi:hypothetical protein
LDCRTSVEMIEKFYAHHVENALDALQINVRRAKVSRARRNSKPSCIVPGRTQARRVRNSRSSGATRKPKPGNNFLFCEGRSRLSSEPFIRPTCAKFGHKNAPIR